MKAGYTRIWRNTLENIAFTDLRGEYDVNVQISQAPEILVEEHCLVERERKQEQINIPSDFNLLPFTIYTPTLTDSNKDDRNERAYIRMHT